MTSSQSLVSKLKQIGTTGLNTLRGSFYVKSLLLEECDERSNEIDFGTSSNVSFARVESASTQVKFVSSTCQCRLGS